MTHKFHGKYRWIRTVYCDVIFLNLTETDFGKLGKKIDKISNTMSNKNVYILCRFGGQSSSIRFVEKIIHFLLAILRIMFIFNSATL